MSSNATSSAYSARCGWTHPQNIPPIDIFWDLTAEEDVKVDFSGVLGLVTGKGRIFFQKGSRTVIMMEQIVRKEGYDFGPGLIQLMVLPASHATMTGLAE